MSTTTEPKSQRDANGRFVKGNSGGPGNPFARQVAALRRALIDAITEEDIKDIATAMLIKARAGDVAAAKLVFSYVLGRPAEAPDPDRLDLDDWQLLHEKVVTDQAQIMKPMCGVPLDWLLKVMPFVVETQNERLNKQTLGGLKRMDAEDKRKEKEKAGTGPRRKPGDRDKVQGKAGATDRKSPSPKGRNGGGKPAGKGSRPYLRSDRLATCPTGPPSPKRANGPPRLRRLECSEDDDPGDEESGRIDLWQALTRMLQNGTAT